MNKTLKKYLEVRSKSLKELEALFYERCKINKQMRKLQKELQAWDKYLVNEIKT